MKNGILTKTAALALAAAMITAMAGCGKQEEVIETQTKVIKVSAITPQRTSLEQKASFTGKVMPDDSVSVYGKASGTVLKTYVEVGEAVTEGQLLYELDPEDYQISLNQAKLAYEQSLKNIDIAESGSGDALTELQYKTAIDSARNAYETARSTLEASLDDDFSMSEFRRKRKQMNDALKAYEDDATEATWKEYVAKEKVYNELLDEYNSNRTLYAGLETAYDAYENALESYEIYKSIQKGENTESYDMSRQQAKLQYDSMLQTMDNLKVYAPISGIIEVKNVSANDQYAPSIAGYVVSNKDIMVVNFSVSGDVVNEMSIGDEVIVENGNSTYTAEITEIGTMVNSGSGLFPIKARFIDAANMLSGVSVKLTAITAKGENAITIPVDAVYYDDGATYVYVLENNTAARRDIIVGIISDDIAEVTDGLTEADTVITSWNANLKEGAAVEISEEV